MVLEPVLCPACQSIDVSSHRRSAQGKSRYRCLNPDCERSTFMIAKVSGPIGRSQRHNAGAQQRVTMHQLKI